MCREKNEQERRMNMCREKNETFENVQGEERIKACTGRRMKMCSENVQGEE